MRALLAYLAMEADRPHPREALFGLLWPDWPQSSALANLRYALSDLRQCIGDREADPPFLLITREAIRWNPDSDYALDVAALEARDWGAGPGMARDATASPPGVLRPLYRGPLLEGLSVGDSPAFEEWLRAQREHLEQRFLALLQRLGEHYERAGDYAQAQRCAERQVELDPVREEAQRRLMRALALGGERNAALAHYQGSRATLAQELGVEPAPETTALYEQIRQGTLIAPAPQRRANSRSMALPTSERSPSASSPLCGPRAGAGAAGPVAGGGPARPGAGGFRGGGAGQRQDDAAARVRPAGHGGAPRAGRGRAATATPTPGWATPTCPLWRSCGCSAAMWRRSAPGALDPRARRGGCASWRPRRSRPCWGGAQR